MSRPSTLRVPPAVPSASTLSAFAPPIGCTRADGSGSAWRNARRNGTRAKPIVIFRSSARRLQEFQREHRLDQLGVERLFEIDSPNRLAEVPWKGLHLLVTDKEGALDADGRRELEVFRVAQRLLFSKAAIGPPGSGQDKVRKELLPRVQREDVRDVAGNLCGATRPD